MDTIKEIDLGSTLLSLIIATGFIAFIILIIRTILITVDYSIYRIKRSKEIEPVSKDDINKKGF